VDPDEFSDEADKIVEFWHRENPDLDVTAKALAIRLRRASQHLERAVRSNLSANGVEEYWEIEVLMSLVRAPNHTHSAGELQRESWVTSGAITNRVGRLERRGWVTREVDPEDRRQVLVSLTEDGLKQAHHVIATKNESEKQIFSGVDRPFLERLTTDLRTLLASMESPAPESAEPGAPDDGSGPRR
jgi:DNA-binding MarR family transcriptional regulator